MLLSTDATRFGFGQVGSEFHSHIRREDMQEPLWIIRFRYEQLGISAWVRIERYEHARTGWVLRPKFVGRVRTTLQLYWVMEAVGIEQPKSPPVGDKSEL